MQWVIEPCEITGVATSEPAGSVQDLAGHVWILQMSSESLMEPEVLGMAMFFTDFVDSDYTG